MSLLTTKTLSLFTRDMDLELVSSEWKSKKPKGTYNEIR